MRKETKRRERSAYIKTALVTGIFVIMWTLHLPEVELKMLIPYIILNAFMTCVTCFFFVIFFRGPSALAEVMEEKSVFEKLNQNNFVEVQLVKSILLEKDPDIGTYAYYKRMGAKFYVKLKEQDLEHILVNVEVDGESLYNSCIDYETFKSNFVFA